jgi:hypothetical protein
MPAPRGSEAGCRLRAILKIGLIFLEGNDPGRGKFLVANSRSVAT